MVNSLYSFNYFPLVSGSGGQDSLDSSDSCSKKTHPHGKIRVHLCHPRENKILIRMINSLSLYLCSYVYAIIYLDYVYIFKL